MHIFKITLILLILFQDMLIDENILSVSFSDLSKDITFVKMGELDRVEKGLIIYDYYTDLNASGHYTFLDFPVDRLAIKLGNINELKEVRLILRGLDGESFYRKIVEHYGMPRTSNLSKYYIEKHGYNIPTETDNFNESTYDDLPQPTVEDFHILRSLAWYDLNKGTENVLTDILIDNRTDPSNTFAEREIWVSFKKAD